MRRQKAPLYGKRFMGNTVTKQVHDLDNEGFGEHECQIIEILIAGHARTFEPDTLNQAHKEGYEECVHCIGSSKHTASLMSSLSPREATE